jgi:hypothetical protein
MGSIAGPPAPHQPNTDAFHPADFIPPLRGKPPLTEQPVMPHSQPTTDAGLSGSWCECDRYEGPIATLGATPTLHNGRWWVQLGKRTMFFGSANASLFPDAPPDPLFGPYVGVDAHCHWASVAAPTGETGAWTTVVPDYWSPIVGSQQHLSWVVQLSSGVRHAVTLFGSHQLKVRRYLRITCSTPQNTHRDYWYACTYLAVAPTQKTLAGVPLGIGAHASLPNPINRAEINAANDLLSYFDVNACTRDSIPVVSAFQNAYNASGLPGHLTVNGQYGPNTQRALQNALDEAQNDAGSGPSQPAPDNCFGRSVPAIPAVDPTPTPTPATPSTPTAPTTTTTVATGGSSYAPLVIGGFAVAGAALIGYTYWRKKHRGHRS